MTDHDPEYEAAAQQLEAYEMSAVREQKTADAYGLVRSILNDQLAMLTSNDNGLTGVEVEVFEKELERLANTVSHHEGWAERWRRGASEQRQKMTEAFG